MAIKQPFGNDAGLNVILKNEGGKGTPATGVTAVEYGDGVHHKTVLTIDTVLPAIAGGANLGVGKLIYTFPAGNVQVQAASMDVAIKQSTNKITADTPEIGLGTVIASGAVDVLSGTATFEDILTASVAADCNGTATKAMPALAAPVSILAADAHTVHLNTADGWAAQGDPAAKLTGTVTLYWIN